MIARKDPASALPPLRRRVIVAPRPRQLSGEDEFSRRGHGRYRLSASTAIARPLTASHRMASRI